MKVIQIDEETCYFISNQKKVYKALVTKEGEVYLPEEVKIAELKRKESGWTYSFAQNSYFLGIVYESKMKAIESMLDVATTDSPFFYQWGKLTESVDYWRFICQGVTIPLAIIVRDGRNNKWMYQIHESFKGGKDNKGFETKEAALKEVDNFLFT